MQVNADGTSQAATLCGTTGHSAPEVVFCPADGTYSTRKVDLFSTGITLHAATFYDLYAFTEEDKLTMMDKVVLWWKMSWKEVRWQVN